MFIVILIWLAREESCQKMIQLLKVKDKAEGQIKAHQVLVEQVNKETLLALCGGTSPDYKKMIVDPADIHPGAVCLTDERWGHAFHQNSNELLIKKSGLIDYLASKKVKSYKYLDGKTIQQTEKAYDMIIRQLFAKFPKRVAVMGVSTNLHTAGIFPHSKALKSPAYVVSEIVDDQFPQRLTITLKALGEFTSFVVLVFGQEKKDALKLMLDVNENDMQTYPAIFFRKCRATAHLITDITF